MNVFISYAMADKNAANSLAQELKAQGFSVTNPTDDIAPGENWALKLGKALEQASAMIALLSPEAAKSKWVQSEIGYALGSPQFQGRLVPVMIKKTESIPWILHDLEILHAPANAAELSRKIGERLRQSTKAAGERSRRGRTAHRALAGA